MVKQYPKVNGDGLGNVLKSRLHKVPKTSTAMKIQIGVGYDT